MHSSLEVRTGGTYHYHWKINV